jgi:hypothetical protein
MKYLKSKNLFYTQIFLSFIFINLAFSKHSNHFFSKKNQTPPPGQDIENQVKKIFIPALADEDPKVKFKVSVQLAGKGDVGSTQILEKILDENSQWTGKWETLLECDSSNGYKTDPTPPQPYMKTPAGRFQPLDTSDNLLYRIGRDAIWDDHGPATYYFGIEAPNGLRGFAAIHNGHVPGRNSHGCVRTTDRCALKIRKLADEVGGPVKILKEKEPNTPLSLIFTFTEAALSVSPKAFARVKRDFSAMVLEFKPYPEATQN